MIVLAPNHVRANNNKIYYQSLLNNRTLSKEGPANTKKYQISNERHDDQMEEREIYEKLCRQNGTEVKGFSDLQIILSLQFLVESKTTIKIILSLST